MILLMSLTKEAEFDNYRDKELGHWERLMRDPGTQGICKTEAEPDLLSLALGKPTGNHKQRE